MEPTNEPTADRLLLLELTRRAFTLHKKIGALMVEHADKFDWKVIEMLDSSAFQALNAHRQLKKAFNKTYGEQLK